MEPWLRRRAPGRPLICNGQKFFLRPEIIDDGVTGLLCDPRDPDSIAGAVIRLLKDGDLRRRVAAAGREMVRERYELSRIIDRNEAYYRRLAKN